MGLIYNYNFDFERYRQVRDRIRLDTKREHTDGLCCFFGLFEKKRLPIDFFGNVLLVAGSVNGTDAEKPLEEIIRGGFSHHKTYYPCSSLEIKHNVDLVQRNGVWSYDIVLRASCRIPPDRPKPDLCIDYHKSREMCNYEKYACTPAEQKERAGAPHIYFYAFDSNEKSAPRGYSVGEMRQFLKGRVLIPVPMNGRKRCRR